MAKYLEHINVINLTSKYNGWTHDVRSMLEEIDDREIIKKAVPGLKIISLLRHLRELKYCCLVSRLTIEKTKKIFPPSRGTLAWPDREDSIIEKPIIETNNYPESFKDMSEIPSDPFLEDMFRRMSDAPYSYDNKEENDLNNYEDEVEGEDGFIREGTAIANNEPYYGNSPEGNGREIVVVVDCYGMYVPSLYKWLRYYSRKSGNIRALMELYHDLENNPHKDGPAVLLSPECIVTICPMIISRSGSSTRNMLSLSSYPDKTFLKMILLHEIGHHVYPAPTKNLSEALANWFLYGFLTPDERLLLHTKTTFQDRPYQMYEGILSLLYYNRYSTIFPEVAFPWPIPAGKEIVESLEQNSFDNKIIFGKMIDRIPWNKLLNWLSICKDLFFEIIWNPKCQGIFNYRKKPWDMQFHSVQVLGYILLHELLYPKGKAIPDLLQEITVGVSSTSGILPMDKKTQMDWLLDKYQIKDR